MADLSVTATQVLVSAAGGTYNGTAGEAITAGQPVYVSTGSTLMIADANATTSATTVASVKGIALNGGATGQPIQVQTGGTITIGAGAAPAVGTVYRLSETAGGIAPVGDTTNSHYVSIIGVGGATNTIKLSIYNSGVTSSAS